MNKNGKYSSAIKVGFLTLLSISILIFTILWIKGRSLSQGERIEVAFQDINGMRAGSGVQMMGLRIGQVEDIIPIMNGKDSFVKLRFVVTEKGVKIPYASTISIQQTGIIGEQFLEVTPPKTKIIYTEANGNFAKIEKNQDIYMKLSKGEAVVAKLQDYEIVNRSQLPQSLRQKFKSKNVLKLAYYVDLPGLVLDNELLKVSLKGNKLYFSLIDGEIPTTPKEGLKYTVMEPMRLSDFMDLQFRAAKSLSATNDRVAEILSDEFIGSIKDSVDNIQVLTKNANTTLEKVEILIDSSKNDINRLTNQSEELISSLTKLSNHVDTLVSDENLKNDLMNSVRSIGKMSDNINKLLEDEQTKEIIANVDTTMKNVNEISAYINEYTKDEKVKEDLTKIIDNLANISQNISKVMDDYNKLDEKDKMKLKDTVKSINTITENMKKFSQKLNKRFLLFRLMF